MTCKMCKERGKTWAGSDPACYFDKGEHNWNCATVNAIRDICEDWNEELPNGAKLTYCGDEKYATIRVYEIGEICEEADVEFPYCLYIQWYKHRGHTDALWLLGEGIARKPTEDELLAVIKYYKEVQDARH